MIEKLKQTARSEHLKRLSLDSKLLLEQQIAKSETFLRHSNYINNSLSQLSPSKDTFVVQELMRQAIENASVVEKSLTYLLKTIGG